jgi:hypothetical protein
MDLMQQFGDEINRQTEEWTADRIGKGLAEP